MTSLPVTFHIRFEHGAFIARVKYFDADCSERSFDFFRNLASNYCARLTEVWNMKFL